MGIRISVYLLVLGVDHCLHLVDFPQNISQTLRQLLHRKTINIIYLLFSSGFGFCLIPVAHKSEEEVGGGSGCLKN
jgi:hypothetical protein